MLFTTSDTLNDNGRTLIGNLKCCLPLILEKVVEGSKPINTTKLKDGTIIYPFMTLKLIANTYTIFPIFTLMIAPFPFGFFISC